MSTLTALVILSTGVWERGAEAVLFDEPRAAQTEGGWTFAATRGSPQYQAFQDGGKVYLRYVLRKPA